MSEPYNDGNRWFVELWNGYELEFPSYEEAWEYYEGIE